MRWLDTQLEAGVPLICRPGGAPTTDREQRRMGDVSAAVQGSWYPLGEPLLLHQHHAHVEDMGMDV